MHTYSILFALSTISLVTATPASNAAATCVNGPVAGTACTVQCNTDHPGGDYKAVPASSLSVCLSACNADTKCVDAQYSHSNNYCYLKNKLTNAKADNNVDSVICNARGATYTTIKASSTTTTTFKSTSTSTTTTSKTTTTTTTTTTTSTTTTSKPTTTTTSTTSTTTTSKTTSKSSTTTTTTAGSPTATACTASQKAGCGDCFCSINYVSGKAECADSVQCPHDASDKNPACSTDADCAAQNGGDTTWKCEYDYTNTCGGGRVCGASPGVCTGSPGSSERSIEKVFEDAAGNKLFMMV